MRSEVDPLLLARLVRELRKRRPDCILINNPAGHGSALMLAARVVGVPIVPVIRDYGWFCAFGVMFQNGQNCSNLCTKCRVFSIARRKLLQGNRCIAISDFVADLVRRFVPTARVDVIHNSVSDNFFSTPIASRDSKRPLRFGYLGRLHPTKGVEQLIDGWIASSAYAEGHRLQLAGDNQGMDFPPNLDELGIDIVGPQPAIHFLDGIDVLVIPSLWGEPFGRTVIEGIARGLYIVGAPNGAIPTLIPAKHGEILPEVTKGAIAAAVQRLIRDPAPVTALRDLNRTEIMAPFRQAAMIDRYEKIIAQVVSDASPKKL